MSPAAFLLFYLVVLSAHINISLLYRSSPVVYKTMVIKFVRFNLYLVLVLGLVFGGGCQTGSDTGSSKKKKATLLELHMEVGSDGMKDNAPVPIGRDPSVMINVEKDAFLDNAYVSEAKVVEDSDGLFSISLHFDARGTTWLETFTTSNPGKRIAIYCDFGPKRWLASPVIHKPIRDGVLTFAPDATREEADRIVKGLNDVAKKIKKDDSW